MSQTPAFVTPDVKAALRPAPINPAWILEGAPVAKCVVLSQSRDGTATTVIWECSEGKFDWFYDRDETLHIFEGIVVLDEGLPTERRVGAGDLVFFPAGSRARWDVKAPVRKLAFVRRALPAPLAAAVNILRKVKRLASPGQESPFGAFDSANLNEIPVAAQSRP